MCRPGEGPAASQAKKKAPRGASWEDV